MVLYSGKRASKRASKRKLTEGASPGTGRTTPIGPTTRLQKPTIFESSMRPSTCRRTQSSVFSMRQRRAISTSSKAS